MLLKNRLQKAGLFSLLIQLVLLRYAATGKNEKTWKSHFSFKCCITALPTDIQKYTMSRNNGIMHFIFACNFTKCWPIFKILSPADLAVNFW